MKLLKRRLLFVAIVTGILFSSTNLDVVKAENNDGEASTHMEQVKYEHKAIRPHFNFYYQLLAEKYAPNHVKIWNDVIKDREALLKKYRELAKEGKEVGNFYDEEWLKAHNEIHDYSQRNVPSVT
ncbi:hypothetical protein AWH56_025955 [Anaerobacillus isosaccharinicus]|uniref:Uncharacterized protein n=1 Tax=Anaerobacillus isosaccharinicus TaxID=1532552 RepID=A0A1S2MFH1_9BACI|nr:hypothetical protein [Anaerobacillus isosaccharinicus]MBA5585649.1 hypothetical protein [Anaerobacillus isosaccharinicus]QOY36043.1 hypothetical protein AWH56_025955 [Anaerobacillus isosaccharinicus]